MGLFFLQGKVLLSLALNYMYMNQISLSTSVSQDILDESLSSRGLFAFVMLLDLILLIWYTILQQTTDVMASLQYDLMIPLIFICLGASYFVVREGFYLGLYLHNVFVSKAELTHVYEYNYRAIGGICLGWVMIDVLRPLVIEYAWGITWLNILFGVCGLLVCVRVCLGLYLDGLYKPPLKYDEVNEFYYREENCYEEKKDYCEKRKFS